MAKFQLLAAGKIGNMIETVGVTGAKYQAMLHECAVQCLAHAEKHGDRSLLARLIGGKIKSKSGEITEDYPGVLSKATDPREVRLWVQSHSPLRWDNDGAIVESKTAKAKGITYAIDAANAQPFWDLEVNAEARQRAINMDNLQAVIFGARKRFEKALKAGSFTGDPVAMKTYFDAVESIPLPKVNPKRVVTADFQERDDVGAVVVQGQPKEAPRPSAERKAA